MEFTDREEYNGLSGQRRIKGSNRIENNSMENTERKQKGKSKMKYIRLKTGDGKSRVLSRKVEDQRKKTKEQKE